MKCPEARELMPAAALGDLEPARRDELAAHTKDCPECRQLWEETRGAAALVDDLAATCAPQDLGSRVIATGRSELGRSRRRRRVALATISVAAAALLIAASLFFTRRRSELEPCDCWRYVAGDTGNCRHSAALRGLPERVLWEKPIAGTAGAYKPLAWGRLIIVGAHPRRRTHRGGGRLLAFDLDNGQVRWKRDFPAGNFYKAKGFPDRCILKGVMYVTDGNACIALNIDTGQPLRRLEPPEDALGWNYLTGKGDHLYGLSRDGRTLFCVEAATGRNLWVRPVGGRAFVPALSGGRLFLSDRDGRLSAFDSRDGRRLWSSGNAPRGRSTIHARGEGVLVIGERDELAAFSAASGTRRWRRELKGAFASGAAIGEHTVHLLAGTVALSLGEGRVLWQNSKDANGLCSAPTLVGEQVLAAAGQEMGSLSVFAADGAVAGQLSDAARRACDGAIVVSGRIFAVAGGRLRAVTCESKG